MPCSHPINPGHDQTQVTALEQRLFGQLSVVCGWFDMDAARAVAARDTRTGAASLVLHLTDRSLISAHRDGGVACYRLRETLRDYGLERLDERGELDAARTRHARWAAGLVAQGARGLRGAGETEWSAMLTRHIEDLRVAHSRLAGRDPRSACA